MERDTRQHVRLHVPFVRIIELHYLITNEVTQRRGNKKFVNFYLCDIKFSERSSITANYLKYKLDEPEKFDA